MATLSERQLRALGDLDCEKNARIALLESTLRNIIVLARKIKASEIVETAENALR